MSSPTVPTNVACFSHMTRLIMTVSSLLTTPRTVYPVAEIALRQDSPKKEMANPNTHDNPTATPEGTGGALPNCCTAQVPKCSSQWSSPHVSRKQSRPSC
ncbi:hypothetical protein LINPERHAP1_LOCUS35916 [Linum perenne]